MNVRFYMDPLTESPKETKMTTKTFPPGWDENRVQRVMKIYENQSEKEAVAEDEAAFEKSSHTVIEIPVELVPAVRELIAKHKRYFPLLLI